MTRRLKLDAEQAGRYCDRVSLAWLVDSGHLQWSEDMARGALKSGRVGVLDYIVSQGDFWSFELLTSLIELNLQHKHMTVWRWLFTQQPRGYSCHEVHDWLLEEHTAGTSNASRMFACADLPTLLYITSSPGLQQIGYIGSHAAGLRAAVIASDHLAVYKWWRTSTRDCLS